MSVTSEISMTSVMADNVSLLPASFASSATENDNLLSSLPPPSSSSSLSPMAASLMTASWLLMKWALPFVIFPGIFGNVMTLVIIKRLHDKGARSSIDIYLQALAICDATVVVTGSLPMWLAAVFTIKLTSTHPATCKLFTFFTNAGASASAWILVLMAMHRAVCVVWPHRVDVMCTPRKSTLFIAMVVVVSCAAWSHQLYGLSVDPFLGVCSVATDAYARFLQDIWAKIDVTMNKVVPFVCLLLSNAVLVIRLRATVDGDSQLVAAGNDAHQAARKRQVNSVTVTAVAVSAAFIVLTLPIGFQNILNMFRPGVGSTDAYVLQMFYQVLFTIVALFNYSVNFYLYCLTGGRFRKEFFAIFGCLGNAFKTRTGDATAAVKSRSATTVTAFSSESER